MAKEAGSPAGACPGGGGSLTIQKEGTLSWRWVAGWTLLTTLALPAALTAMAPIAAVLNRVIRLGGKAGFWHGVSIDFVKLVGFIAALALVLGAIQ